MILKKSLPDLPVSTSLPVKALLVLPRTARRARKAAVAFAAVLLSMSFLVIAAPQLLSRTVKLQLVPSAETVAPDDSLTLTVNTVNPQNFKKGVAGLTLDIYYDSTVMEYDAVTGISSTLDDTEFSVDAHEYETGKIAVLLYGDALDTDGKLFAIQDAGALFSLPFSVKSGVTAGSCTFSIPDGYKLADYDDGGTGFAYATITPAPENATVTVEDLTIPSYTISIPSGAVNLAGAGHTPLGQISLASADRLPENGLIVTMSGANGKKLLKTGDSTKQIPYILTEDTAQTPYSNVVFTAGGANDPGAVYAYIAAEDWNAAAAGKYTGTVTFTVAENS